MAACAVIISCCAASVGAYKALPGLVINRLTNDGKSYTTRGAGFAPRGNYIVFYKEAGKTDRQLWLMRDDGTQAEAISPVGWPMISGWSPDGTKIAYVFANKNDGNSEASVRIYDIAARETKAYSGGYKYGHFGAGGYAPPTWSPDSTHFCYHIVDPSREAFFATIFSVDGSVPVRLGENLEGTQAHDSQGSWSPDGKQIVFCAYPTKGAAPELWISNIDGTGLRQLTDNRRDCGEPKWSPDGQWIVFFSAKDRYPDEVRVGGLWDIMMIRPDGKDQHTLISGRSQSKEGRNTFVHPDWARDQNYIICYGVRRDAAGRGHNSLFFIDWKQKKWCGVLGSELDSRGYNTGHDWGISPDSQKVFHHGNIYTLRGPNQDQTTDRGDVLEVYDVPAKKTTRLLEYRKDEDPYSLYWDAESWAPDSKRILICQGKVISWSDQQFEPDLYVVEVPGDAPKENETDGGSEPATPAAQEPPTVPPSESPESPSWALIQPENMTVEQALECLPADDKACILINRERNLLIVNGTPELAQRIRAYIREIDTPAPQVTLDVLVTEMSKSASRTLGLDWTFAKGHKGAQLPFSGLGPGQLFYQGVQALEEKFFVALNALEENGEVTIRANPRLLAVSGKTATMNIRRTKYYFYTQGYDQFGRPISQQSDISADIGGKITPRVMGNGNIAVDIDVTVGNFAFTTSSSLPDVTTRQASTSVVVKQDQTIMIGGLVLKQDTRTTSKTPILGDIPVLGKLFQSNHKRTEENVLGILITPHLGAEQAAAPMQK